MVLFVNSLLLECPGQNEVAKHKLRHLLEDICALLFQIQVLASLWSDGVLTAGYLVVVLGGHILPCSTSSFTTSLGFGCSYYVHALNSDRNKLRDGKEAEWEGGNLGGGVRRIIGSPFTLVICTICVLLL